MTHQLQPTPIVYTAYDTIVLMVIYVVSTAYFFGEIFRLIGRLINVVYNTVFNY